jgi:cytochrome c553
MPHAHYPLPKHPSATLALPRRPTAHLALALISLGTACLAASQAQVPTDHAAKMKAGTALFSSSIRPAIEANCLECHGGDKTRGGLDLATRASLLAGGDSGAAIDLANPANSLLILLSSHQEEPTMPPKKQPLPEALLADLTRWIELGAPYDQPLAERAHDAPTSLQISQNDRDFWSFRPLASSPPPTSGQGWAITPIDHFIHAALDAAHLAPSPPADRRTLARRAALELLGLPPTPEQVEAFLADPDPDAWPRYLTTLLDSPHYGERMARHWMDVARFAESSGFEHDYDRPNAYHYRDFLIQAFNSDLPWDNLSAWQIAGDELAPHDPLAWKATGFLAAGVFPTQITEAEFELTRYDELDDMVGTMGAAFLGLSISCARCHDHKYDPIPAADYYRLAAVFSSTIRSEKQLEFKPATLDTQLADWEQEHLTLTDELAAYTSITLDPQFAAWLDDPSGLDQLDAASWHLLDLSSASSREGIPLSRQPDGTWLASGKAAPHDEYTLVVDAPAGTAAIRLEALTHPTMPRKGPGRANNGNFALGNFTITARPASDPSSALQPLPLSAARATHEQNDAGLSVASSLDADPNSTGWAVDLGGIGSDQAAIFTLAQPLTDDFTLTLTLRFHVNTAHALGRFRFSSSPDPEADFDLGTVADPTLAAAITALTSTPPPLSQAHHTALQAHFYSHDKGWQARSAAIDKHLASRPAVETRAVLVSTEGLPPVKNHADGRGYPHFYPEVHILLRGDPKQRQQVATPGILQVLSPATNPDADIAPWSQPAPPDSPSSHRRAALARWLTDHHSGAGHLLARVAVNRAWQQHFGTGLVATPNDFGLMGEPPSHPELLDWLAQDLIDHGWQLKRLHLLIMSSATYQQSASSPDATYSDPDLAARLLAHFPSRRLEAEAIRDSLLAVSGLLDPTLYGPGSRAESMVRRSIYFTIKRSQLPGSMLVFDWPEHLVSIGHRTPTTVAPQALYLMNSPQARHAAEALAARSGGDLAQIYDLALNRPPTDAELAAANSFLEHQATLYPPATAAAGALSDFCQALLSSNEFLHIP